MSTDPLLANLESEVLAVLTAAAKGKTSRRPQALTAYQILDRVPSRDALIREYGIPGAASGNVGSNAATCVMFACRALNRQGKVRYHYFDSVGATYTVAGQPITPGSPVTAMYQLTSLGLGIFGGEDDDEMTIPKFLATVGGDHPAD